MNENAEVIEVTLKEMSTSFFLFETCIHHWLNYNTIWKLVCCKQTKQKKQHKVPDTVQYHPTFVQGGQSSQVKFSAFQGNICYFQGVLY